MTAKAKKEQSKIDRSTSETITLLSWCFWADCFREMGYYKTWSEIMLLIPGFIRTHGTEQDIELLKRIPDLIKDDIARIKTRKKEAVSVDAGGGESIKKWVAQLLKGIAEDMGK